MSIKLWLLPLLLALSACATVPRPRAATVEVQILAFNDFHGHLDPPGLTIPSADGAVPAGGVAYLAGALKQVRTAHSVTVSAGDLIGASPLISSLFLDEPTIAAMNVAGLDYNAVGNHEFDRGTDELRRMQAGGCARHTARAPCRVEPFAGARFGFLAANVLGPDGRPILPGTALRKVGGITLGFIGITLRATPTMVVPSGATGLRFDDEVETANTAARALTAQGADAVVLLIHQGGTVSGGYDDPTCPGLDGPIVAIATELDPAIALVVSGHTHKAYRCRLAMPGGGERLLTSSGQYGTLITDIRLSFADGKAAGSKVNFVIVQGEPIANAKRRVPLNPRHPRFAPDPVVAEIVARYRTASAAEGDRVVGRLRGVAAVGAGAAEAVADSMWFATRAPAAGRADLALTNTGGARADLIPAADGAVTFAQIAALQPFANRLVTITMTGAQLKAVIEQGLADGARRNILVPSANMRFAYDLSRATGERLTTLLLENRSIDPAALYRVTVPNFLAEGGDGFTVFRAGVAPVEGGGDLDAMEAWLASSPPALLLGRAIDRTPPR